MEDIQYYVIVDKSISIDNENKEKIDKVEVEFIDTKFPFRTKLLILI